MTAKNAFCLCSLSAFLIAVCVGSGYINVAIVFWQGSKRFVEGEASLANVVAIAIVTKGAAFFALNVGANVEAFAGAVAAIRRLTLMIRRVPPTDSSCENGCIPSSVKGNLEMVGVRHVYPSRPGIVALHDVSIGFPEGYNTTVGARGSRLSGGQLQRIAIARALVSDPCILVLDEATSALDTETENRLLSALARDQRERTTIVIAHRLSTIRKADKIVVLQAGKVVETGQHYDLMTAKFHYYELVKTQNSHYEGHELSSSELGISDEDATEVDLSDDESLGNEKMNSKVTDRHLTTPSGI